MQHGILGVWTLRSFHMETVETGERSEPFGPDPRGTLIFHADGRMAALMTPRERLPSPDPAAAFPILAYSGRFRLEPPDRLVTAVDVAGFAHWLGTDQQRFYRLEGDALDIVTPPGPMPREGAESVTVRGVLSWTREAPSAPGDMASANA